MKQEEFERLKTVLKKEGYLLSTGGVIPGASILVEIYKKDVWDGAEYGCWPQSDSEFFIKGKTYRFFNQFDHTYSETGRQHFTNEVWVKSNFLPSTESAYIEQLKKEAFERFREIRNGDIFKQPWFHSPVTIQGENKGFTYESFQDSLFFNGWAIYHSGKWATKVKERVKVEFRDHLAVGNYDYHSHSFTIDVSRNAKQFDPEKAGQFLASQLEKYLNGEIGKENSNV